MTLTLKVNEFGSLATSGTLDDAVREPDFMTRAIKLFNLREKVWGAFNKTKKEIDAETEKEAEEKASMPGYVGLLTGTGLGFVGMLTLLGAPFTLPIFGVAAAVGLVAGFFTRGAARLAAKKGPEEEGAEAQKLLEYSRKNMAERIETELERMDSSLFSQKPEIRDEFRNAFKHAAAKQEIRESRIHRAKIEQEAEETREAAQTAATMATIAAVNAATASMSHRR
jgi:hypothetical protein